jgi:hypothetical protein
MRKPHNSELGKAERKALPLWMFKANEGYAHTLLLGLQQLPNRLENWQSSLCRRRKTMACLRELRLNKPQASRKMAEARRMSPIIVKCAGCGLILHKDYHPKIWIEYMHELMNKLHGRCPSCKRRLELSEAQVKVCIYQRSGKS